MIPQTKTALSVIDLLICSFSTWTSRLSSCRRAGLRNSQHRRLAERLEARILPATIVVTSLVDTEQIDGRVSLREAINAANNDRSIDGSAAGNGNDQIVFSSGLSGTITLKLGQMTLTSPMSISGNGIPSTIIDANRLSRIFNVSSTAGDVTFRNMTIRNGKTQTGQTLEPGGAILYAPAGTLTVNLCALIGNRTTGASSNGGAIHVSKGSLLLTKSSFTDNMVEGRSSMGGAIAVQAKELTSADCVFTSNAALHDLAGGGAIVSRGSLKLQRCEFVSNSTTLYSSPGGAVYCNGLTAVVDSCTFTKNTTTGENSSGGALFFQSTTSAQIIASRFSGNQSAGKNAHGGAVSGGTEFGQCQFEDNVSVLGSGGAVSSGTVNISQSKFLRNKSLNGGAISTSSCTVTGSFFDANQVVGTSNFPSGGAIRTGSLNMSSSTVQNNFASSIGGGISASGDVTIVQSTINGNSTDAGGRGGGLASSGLGMTIVQSTISGNTVRDASPQGSVSTGGGIYFGGKTFKLIQSTVAGNSAINGNGGGMFFPTAIDASAATVFDNSIVAGNTDNGFGPDVKSSRTLTMRNSLLGTNSGTSLSENAVGDLNGNLIGGPGVRVISPRLGPLRNNGGSTATHALLPESPALNRGRNSLALDPTTGNAALIYDQRGSGFDRILDGVIDMGAVEALVLRGTTSNDLFSVTYSGNSTTGTTTITISTNGSPARTLGTYPIAAPIVIAGLAGVDMVRVNGMSDKNRFQVAGSNVEANNSLVVLDGVENLELIGAANDDTYVLDADSKMIPMLLDDSGGVDTIDFSLTTAQSIFLDLRSSLRQTVNSNLALQLKNSTAFEDIIGGSINDSLIGNAGANVLVGGPGDDYLDGQAGNDLVIGGLGLDQLNGGDNDDIVIAGRTTLDGNINALNDLITEWKSASPFATRVSRLRSGVGVSRASLVAKLTVLNDTSPGDRMYGGTGQDWFFRSLDEFVTDQVFGEISDIL